MLLLVYIALNNSISTFKNKLYQKWIKKSLHYETLSKEEIEKELETLSQEEEQWEKSSYL